MASRSAVLSLAEAGISPQVGAPPADVLDPSFAPSERDGLLVIDVQTDFMPGGALEVPGGTEVIPIVNALVRRFEHVVLSQDWHPPKHSSFASQHEGKSPYDETQMPYGAQTLWPDHCVQNTPGSAFHADLAIPARAHLPQGLPVGHRLVQRVLRERPGHGDGAPGALPGARRHDGIRGRGGVRLLRTLLLRGRRGAVRRDGRLGEGRDARGGPPRVGGSRGEGAGTGGGADRERRGAEELKIRG